MDDPDGKIQCIIVVEHTDRILEVVKDGGPSAYVTTPRPNVAQSYRINATV